MNHFAVPEIGRTHNTGAERYGLLWLRANERAVKILRDVGVDFDSRSGREQAAVTSAVVLAVLDACASGSAIRSLTRVAAEQRLGGAERS